MLLRSPLHDRHATLGAKFAEAVVAAVQGTGLEVEVLEVAELQAGGYGGILAVGLGSEAPPRLV